MKHSLFTILLLGTLNISAQTTPDRAAEIEAEMKKYEEELVILGDKITVQQERIEKFKKKIIILLQEITETKKRAFEEELKDPTLIENEYKKYIENLGNDFEKTLQNIKTIDIENLNISIDSFFESPSLETVKFNMFQTTVEMMLLSDHLKEWQNCFKILVHLSDKLDDINKGTQNA